MVSHVRPSGDDSLCQAVRLWGPVSGRPVMISCARLSGYGVRVRPSGDDILCQAVRLWGPVSGRPVMVSRVRQSGDGAPCQPSGNPSCAMSHVRLSKTGHSDGSPCQPVCNGFPFQAV